MVLEGNQHLVPILRHYGENMARSCHVGPGRTSCCKHLQLVTCPHQPKERCQHEFKVETGGSMVTTKSKLDSVRVFEHVSASRLTGRLGVLQNAGSLILIDSP